MRNGIAAPLVTASPHSPGMLVERMRGRGGLPPFDVSHALSSSVRYGGGLCGQQPLAGSAGAVSVQLRPRRPGPGRCAGGGLPGRRPSSNGHMKTLHRETGLAVCPYSGLRGVEVCGMVRLCHSLRGPGESSSHVVRWAGSAGRAHRRGLSPVGLSPTGFTEASPARGASHACAHCPQLLGPVCSRLPRAPIQSL